MAGEKITNKDYFSILVAMTDPDNEINDSITNGKPIDEFLAKRFGLSKPTVGRLILSWQQEGLIEVEQGFSGKIIKLRIIKLPNRHKNKILVLIDFENLVTNMEVPPLPEGFSIKDGIDGAIKQIAQEVGEIADVLIFAPPHMASLWGMNLYELGLHIVSCPWVKTKKGEDKNTTDEILIERGKRMIALMPNLTHLCIGSGDRDFSLLVREAIRKGLKIIVLAGNQKSLSPELINLTDRKPNGEKMVYILSPTKE